MDFIDDLLPFEDGDRDGLADWEEDLNRNGIVDGAETDPSEADTDNDGLTDGQEIAREAQPIH